MATSPVLLILYRLPLPTPQLAGLLGPLAQGRRKSSERNKMALSSGNLIKAEVNVSHERKRQVETELMNAINGTTSTFLDRPVTNPEYCRSVEDWKIGKLRAKTALQMIS